MKHLLHRLYGVDAPDHLQSVLNAAARSIAGLRRSDHITDTLVEGPGAYSV